MAGQVRGARRLYHLTRAPKYAAKLAVRAPVGVFVALAAVVGWVFDREATPLRADAVHRGSVADYMTLSKQRNQRVKRCATLAGVGLLVLAVVTVWAAVGAPWWVEWLNVAAVVAVLGKLGTPPDRRITDVATVNAAAPRG